MAVKTKPLPSKAELHKLLDYVDGKLYWKYRPQSMFKTTRAWKSWNARFCGREALCSTNKAGTVLGVLNGDVVIAARVVWKMHRGTEPMLLRHKNGDSADNRIENLIACHNPVPRAAT